jgi:hypothetical protein
LAYLAEEISSKLSINTCKCLLSKNVLNIPQSVERILEFHPPPFSLVFELEIRSVLYPAPTVTVVITFGVSVTIDYAIVLDTKGIREAITEKNPIKALNSFAFRDTFDGVDTPLVVFEASVTASVEVSAVIVKVGVSGGITIIIGIDFYDPNPTTSGGLIRPFELISISPNPLDWFEITINAYVTLSAYVQVGIFLGFIEIVLFELKKEFIFVIIDSLTITPSLVDRLATIGATGIVTVAVLSGPITCKHMDGGSGDETVQCWESNVEYPVIAYFEGVRSLQSSSDGSAQGRRLELSIQSSENVMILDCIESETDCSMQERIELRYDQCQINGGELKISGGEVIASGPVKFRSGTLISGEIYMPVPSQDFLVTQVGRDCNAEWILHGDTSLIIMGSQLEPGCQVVAHGSELDSELRIDLALAASQTCAENSVLVDLDDADTNEPRGRVFLDGVEKVRFNSMLYNDILIYGRMDCHDNIHVMQTSETVKSVDIQTFSGDDTIVIGKKGFPYESFIHADIIIDSGDGLRDTIIVYDGSSNTKNQKVSFSSIEGIQFGSNENRTFTYTNTEFMDLTLGEVVDVDVIATETRFDLTIRYSNTNSNNITSASTSGPLNIISEGDSNEKIVVTNAVGGVFIDLGEGEHVIEISETLGTIYIITDGSGGIEISESISITHTQGKVDLNLGPAVHAIDVKNTSPGTWSDIENTQHKWGGDVRITCEAGSNEIDVSNIGGDLFVQTGGGGDDVVHVFSVLGDLTITCLDTGNDHIEVDHASGDKTIMTNLGNDIIIIRDNATVSTTVDAALFKRERSLLSSSYLNISGGSGDDLVQIFGLRFGTIATVLGGGGNDTLKIDGRCGESYNTLPIQNTLDGTSLYWNGGADEGDDDIVDMYFVSAGNTQLNLLGDNLGHNYVTLRCADIACVILSRDTFLANM